MWAEYYLPGQVNISGLEYGQSCSYRVLGSCGYPNLRFEGSSFDVVIGYNRTQWSLNYAPNKTYWTWDLISTLE